MNIGIGEILIILAFIVIILLLIAVVIGIVRYAVHGSLKIDKGHPRGSEPGPNDQATQHDR